MKKHLLSFLLAMVMALFMLPITAKADTPDFDRVQLWEGGPYWATMNIGATSPEEYGDYYAWGEIEPYYSSLNPLTFKFGKDAGYDWSSYCGQSSFTEWSTLPYDTTSQILKSDYDAATQVWGDEWRTPTIEEASTLFNMDYCKTEWTNDYNGTGTKGVIITGVTEGYTDKCIFLPANGWGNMEAFLQVGSECWFWTATKSTEMNDRAQYFLCVSSGSFLYGDVVRYTGLAIRAVSDVATKSFASLQQEINESTAFQTIKLTSDLTAMSTEEGLVIPKGKTITLDLNSYTLNRALSSAKENGYVIKVEEGATLTICDNSKEKTGTIKGGYNKGNGGGIVVESSAKLNLKNVSISNNRTELNGGGIYNAGGTVTTEYCKLMKNNADCNGGGIYTGDTENYSFIGFTGSVITECSAKNGGGVYTAANGRFETGTVLGGITECYASENGGGVYTEYDGTSTFSQFTVSENVATLGGGIYSNGSLGFENITVSDCVASTNGSGVYLDSKGRIFAGSTANVSANKKGQDDNNVYLADGAVITLGSGSDVAAPLSQMKLGISMEKPGVFTTNGKEEYVDYFVSDNSSLVFEYVAANTFEGIDYDCLAFTNTVCFETNGGTAVAPVSIISNTSLAKPKNPTMSGKVLAGWYLDEGLKNEYDFSKPVTANLKLFAKWHSHSWGSTYEEYDTTNHKWAKKCACGEYDTEHALTGLAIPKANTGLVYNGEFMVGFDAGYLASYCVMENTIAKNAGSYIATFTFKDSLEGFIWSDGTMEPKQVAWSIAPLVLKEATAKDAEYTGSKLTPEITFEAGKLVLGTDYKVSEWSGELVDPGKYTATVTFMGNYEGSAKVTFTILPCSHDFEEVAGLDATEEVAGYLKSYKCKICGKYFADNEGKKTIGDEAAYTAWKAEGGEGYLAPLPKKQPTFTIEEKELKANSYTLRMDFKAVEEKSAMKVTWSKVKDADGYFVFAGMCGKSLSPIEPIRVKGAKKTSITLKSIGAKKYDKKEDYKVYVVAYKTVDGEDFTIAQTVVGHVAGSKMKYTNAKAITIKSTKVSVKKGKSVALNAKVTKVDTKKSFLSAKHAPKLRYEASNDKIKVDANGKVKGVKKGTAYVYIYAQNGMCKKVKVTVK